MLISPKAGNFAVFAGQPGYNLLKQRTFIFHDKGRTSVAEVLEKFWRQKAQTT